MGEPTDPSQIRADAGVGQMQAHHPVVFTAALAPDIAAQLELVDQVAGGRRMDVQRLCQFAHALPGLGNNWQVMLKSTAIVSLIGLADMTWLADQAGRTTRQPFVFYLIVCVLYLAMTWVSGRAIGWLDRKYAAGVRQPAS